MTCWQCNQPTDDTNRLCNSCYYSRYLVANKSVYRKNSPEVQAISQVLFFLFTAGIGWDRVDL